MAVAIIRQLTLAQVQAAIDAGSTSWNNNYAGTQVYVTDKDWHLACYLDRVAKPLSGVLKITNGDTLPAWLTPETLLIDTGTISTDQSAGFNLITLAGYIATGRVFIKASSGYAGEIALIIYGIDIVANLANGGDYIFHPAYSGCVNNELGNNVVTGEYVVGESFQVIVEFKKLYM